MTIARRLFAAAVLVAIVSHLCGCQTLDLLHPRNTWKMNRGPALDENAYFSISDPVGEGTGPRAG